MYPALKLASQRVHVNTTRARGQTPCSSRLARLLGRQHGDDKTDSREGLNVWGNSSALHKTEFPIISQYSFVSMGQSRYENINVCSL
uniref:Reprolysin n=1 Tax=Rhipicephalus zambeziensis TaxID=60191 RepID=A0A224YE82_9ACAR